LVLRDPMVDAKGNRTTWQGPCHIFGNRLYIPGDQLVVLDISSPLSPKIISKSPYGFGLHGPASGSGGPVLEYAIEPVPGLTNEQQFELAGPPGYGYENGLLLQESQISSRENALELYKLDVLASTRARFVRIAERKPTPMESLFHADHYSTLFLKGGKIYALNRDTSALNPIINIYSATGPHPLERIGHFGAISITGICPLSDGRCIVVGGTYEYQRSNKLWLLGPPPAH
jgi:hypothetical protein